MVLFVDRSLFASKEKLLCLVMNLPICGWNKESAKNVILATLKMEAVYYPKYRQVHAWFHIPKLNNIFFSHI